MDSQLGKLASQPSPQATEKLFGGHRTRDVEFCSQMLFFCLFGNGANRLAVSNVVRHRPHSPEETLKGGSAMAFAKKTWVCHAGMQGWIQRACCKPHWSAVMTLESDIGSARSW